MLRRGWLLAAFVLASFLPPLLGATPGSFRGVIVSGANDRPGWIWVKSPNGMLRKVGVDGATVVYDDAVSKHDRLQHAEDSMQAGAEVRVTASQDGDGEWRASRIEILRLKAPEPVIEPSRRKPGKARST